MIKLNIDMRSQKESECLPACLRAVFEFYKIDVPEEEIIEKISKDSGKLYDWTFRAGKLAIEKGLQAEVYGNVTQLFDPSWHEISHGELIGKIEKELEYFKDRDESFIKCPELATPLCPHKDVAEGTVRYAKALLEFLKYTGTVNFHPISKEMIVRRLEKGSPVIMMHNATLLHRMQRYNFDTHRPDDIKGLDWGHAAVISGEAGENFLISDPSGEFYEGKLAYEANKDLVLESILRKDEQLLVISR